MFSMKKIYNKMEPNAVVAPSNLHPRALFLLNTIDKKELLFTLYFQVVVHDHIDRQFNVLYT